MTPEQRQRLAQRIRKLRGDLRMVRSTARTAMEVIRTHKLKRRDFPLTQGVNDGR